MEQALYSAFQADVPQADAPLRRRAFDRRLKPIYLGLALTWILVLIAFPIASLSLDVGLTVAFFVVCGVLVWAAACLRLRGLARIAMGLEAWTLLTIASLTGILGSYVAARHGAPFADHWMDAADRMIAPGFGWKQTILALSRHPVLMQCANRVYASLQWQGALLIATCCIANQPERCAAFVLRWMIVLALVCVIFAFLPCNGAYATYHIAHSAVPTVRANIGWRQPELLAWLRSSGQLQLDSSALDGIIEFPSFHAAAATLFAWGFWTIRWARWPMLALNVAMIAAAVPIGGHYYVDILAGIAIAAMSIALPGWCSQLGDRRIHWKDRAVQ